MDVQPSFPPLRACIFDVDGLLINSEDIYTDVHNKILHSYGKPSLAWRTKALLQSRGPIGEERFITGTSLPLTPTELHALVATHHAPFQKCQPLPGVLPLLNNLTHASPPIHLAMASSTTKPFFATKTSHLPALTSYFTTDTCLFSDDDDMRTKKGKPAGDIFLLAMERINLSLATAGRVDDAADVPKLRPEECLVFEDSIAGVAAGRAAGMRVCWVPHEGLREVCKGMERDVLAGKMEVEERLLAMKPGAGGKEPEAVGTRGEEAGGVKKGKVDRIVSEDGWAEMIGSMEDFDYANYGINVNG
ncbi:MAG: hypothetical protein Q9171_007086 [Xanthocarpia ochracea]